MNNASESVKKKQVVGKMVVRSHYFTPSEAAIPSAINRQANAHRPIPLNPNLPIQSVLEAQKTNPEYPKPPQRTEIDGFYLLEAANNDFPEDVQHLTLTDKNLRSVIDEDLTYFSDLFFLDVSENYLPFTPFGALPNLQELRMACNHMQTIDDLYGFNKLMYLDLSYNQLSVDSIMSLSVLPMLKELDLCGNNLSTLPPDLSNFQSLEKILLEYNKFDNNRIFQILGTIPNIRFIDLSHNYLSFIPRETCEYGGLRLLETLDLAFNFFVSEESIEAIVLLNRLTTLILYGNPLLGPTGEDPMFIYIESLVDKASQIRQASGTTLPDIDFITEIPRKRNLKKGSPLGRRALYRDFSIVQVESEKSSDDRAWKKRGIITPFVEVMSRRNLHTPSLANDFTFITNSLAGGTAISNKKVNINSGLNDVHTNAIADDVMKKIASEMGLVGTDELNLFEEYATLPKTVIESELYPDSSVDHYSKKPTMQNNIDADPFSFFQTGPLPKRKNDEDDSASVRSLSDQSSVDPNDHLPSSLFGASNMIANKPLIPTQPIALRTAMKELRRALEQPLTNYDEIPSKWPGNVNDFHRDTKASKLRQLPRLRSISQNNEDVFHPKDTRERVTPAAQQQNEEHRQKTLDQLNNVLEKLNESTRKITVRSDSQHQGSTNLEQNMSVKKNMESMRHFAKPQSVRGLVSMVHNIIHEFNT